MTTTTTTQTTRLTVPTPQPETQSQPEHTQSWTSWLLDAYASTATSPVTSEFPFHSSSDHKHTYSTDVDSSTTYTYDQDPSAAAAAAAAAARQSPPAVPSSSAHAPPPQPTSAPMQRSVTAPPTKSVYDYGPYVRTGRGGAGNVRWGSYATGGASVQPRSRTLGDEVGEHQGDQGPLGRYAGLGERRERAKGLARLHTGGKSVVVVAQGRGGAGNVLLASSVEGGQGRSVSAPNPGSVSSRSGISGAGGMAVASGRGGAGNQAKGVEEVERKRREKEEEERREGERRWKEVEGLVDQLLQRPPTAVLGERRVSWVV